MAMAEVKADIPAVDMATAGAKAGIPVVDMATVEASQAVILAAEMTKVEDRTIYNSLYKVN